MRAALALLITATFVACAAVQPARLPQAAPAITVVLLPTPKEVSVPKPIAKVTPPKEDLGLGSPLNDTVANTLNKTFPSWKAACKAYLTEARTLQPYCKSEGDPPKEVIKKPFCSAEPIKHGQLASPYRDVLLLSFGACTTRGLHLAVTTKEGFRVLPLGFDPESDCNAEGCTPSRQQSIVRVEVESGLLLVEFEGVAVMRGEDPDSYFSIVSQHKVRSGKACTLEPGREPRCLNAGEFTETPEYETVTGTAPPPWEPDAHLHVDAEGKLRAY
jgi:hypothetical protein